MQADFMRSATAKGGTWLSVVRRHGLRNSLGPVLSMAGLQIGMMLGSSVIVELIFSWPGVGNYLAQSIKSSDFAAITGVVLVLGVAYVFINFVVDTLQVLVDPRQRSAS
jgi:peptide/nickel transport system permease protein